ncbi:MAG TPA: PmoA family protein [Candidatus Hydrogenedentes bacterium]|nr:PmoA family protein [Candidatus Hydrogenedentota bacterium]HOT49518.1 PmoA family protein [Candidatus Hydrogenedentota bacterium]HOV75652.1 PmoA family protein [Candidatus Hydrogenedentota bacterium]HPC17483.1 PmoA family protein [Candidatus Hydrogenedentota bacterium]HRT21433.1 PmoA family protein [Candidatus Hydrogenedentota bacterium]
MRKSIGMAVILVLAAGIAAAQPLDGRKLSVTGGDTAGSFVPVAVAYEGPAPDGPVQVVDTKSGKAFPATIAGGELVFIVEAIAPGETIPCQVKILKEKTAPKVNIARIEGDRLEVTVNGEPFTVYNYSNDNRKPFLWPVYGEGKVGMTRNWPMDPNETISRDHVHHKGIWTSYGDLNGVDCWGETGDKAGFQHSDEVTFGSGDAFAWIKAKNTWQDKDHKPVIAEEREYRFYATPASARLFDQSITFTAAHGTVLFKDTKEGGLVAFRIRPDITETSKKGVITNASGAHGMKECWGKPSPWTDYSGPIEGVGTRGIAVFDYPKNMRYPTTWHIRDYGLNGANCFGLSYFTEKSEKKENGDFTLEDGKAVTFRYRVMIHSGDVNEAKVADRCADFTNPPKADWVH